MPGRKGVFPAPMFRASSKVFMPLVEDHGVRRVTRSIEVEVDGHLIRAALVATPSREAMSRRGAESFFAYVQKKELELTKDFPDGMPEIEYRKRLAQWVDSYNTYVGGKK